MQHLLLSCLALVTVHVALGFDVHELAWTLPAHVLCELVLRLTIDDE